METDAVKRSFLPDKIEALLRLPGLGHVRDQRRDPVGEPSVENRLPQPLDTLRMTIDRNNPTGKKLGEIQGLCAGSAAEIEYVRGRGKLGAQRESFRCARSIAGALPRQALEEFEEDVSATFIL